MRTVTAASRFDTGGMTTRWEDHASDTRSPQRLSGTAAETSLVMRDRSTIAVSLEPTTAWSSSELRVIAIMGPALRSHVEEKLTAVDHLPKVSRIPLPALPGNP